MFTSEVWFNWRQKKKLRWTIVLTCNVATAICVFPDYINIVMIRFNNSYPAYETAHSG